MLAVEDDLQIPRSSVKETYDFIIKDLEEAAQALPATGKVARGRVSSMAAHALLIV